MNLVALAVRQPVTVAVGVILVLLAGIVAVRRIPIQLTPNVEDTIIAVTTTWEGASPVEVEREVVDPQEEKLQGIANLRAITSTSQQGQGVIRLEFAVGTSKEAALREVSDKLREVPSYPVDVDEPVIEASDPENRDYIAWIVLDTEDPDFDVRTLQDFAEDRIEPVLERIAGISEVNILGGREREVQVLYDPEVLAAKGLTPSQLAQALLRENRDVSAGALQESKSDVRVRLAGQYQRIADVEDTVIAQTPGGPVFVRDVAAVVETFKEPRTFVRSRGKPVLAVNAQKEVGANVMAVMAGLQERIGQLNEPGGTLEVEARKLGLDGGLRLTQVYDQTIYIDDALALVRNNIWLGGALAILVLILFLRSVRTVGIIALAIPISVIGAVVSMVALGRTVNVISLAGMAFAVGMVVDNAIVVLENIYRHVEMGKPPMRAAIVGGKEVFGAVLASTLTTVAVFIPILLIEEEAGQLFRDISLAIVAAVALSLLVSVTVIPSSAARLLRAHRTDGKARRKRSGPSDWIADTVHRLNGSVLARLAIVVLLAAASIVGTAWLIPPTDYLPTGNRNLVFGLLIPPPGYNLDQQAELALRIEETVEPYWEAAKLEPDSPERAAAVASLPPVPTFDMAAGRPGEPVVPPPLVNYFLVSFDGIMFHGGISDDPRRVVDLMPLFAQATRGEVAPGVLAFAFQVPLFQLGGRTGSAIKINFAGDDLDQVAAAAESVMLELMGRYSPYSVQPDPSNFNVPTPELRLVPDRRRRAETGLTFDDVAFAVQTLGDGALLGEYRMEGESVDLKVISRFAAQEGSLDRVADSPIATPRGTTVPLSAVATPMRVNAAQQINRVGRQRAITLQFTPPEGVALEQAVQEVAQLLAERREAGLIPPTVDTSFTGSASKLAAVQSALLGDGTLAGTLGSSLVLALLVVYLLLCVLFQSFMRPLIILFSVPLATLGGFAALHGVYVWSLSDPYMPVQQLDILTMLGFVVLIGVVVNNAILIVHQALNFMRPPEEEGDVGNLAPREAITEAVRSRVRPIFMSTLTSVGGMAPLVLMPGSGSELYRGLGSVVVGGLVVSTVFTLLLVPLLMSLVTDLQRRLGIAIERPTGRVALGDAAALVLALVCALGFSSCAARDDARPRFGDLASRIAREVVADLPPGDAVPRLVAPDSRVAEALGARLDELERLGGEASWAEQEPDWGADLYEGTDALRPLALEEALGIALEHNLGLRFARLQPLAAAEAETVAEALFDPLVFADLEYERVDEPQPVPILGGVQLGTPKTASGRARVQAGVSKLLRSGATVSATTFFERFDNKTSGIEFEPDPAWRSGVGVEVDQPLLRGYGEEVVTAETVFAERRTERLEEELRADALALAALVEQAYWDLAEAHARLLVQQRLAQRGADVERVLAQRREFDAQPAQYADALATLEQRRADLIRARDLVRRSSDTLVALMDWREETLAGETLLLPTSDFALEPVPIDLRASVAEALARRPELRAALLDVEDAELRVALADDLERARLDLFARVDVLGLDDSFGESVDDVFEEDFLDAAVGLHFEVPLGNRAGEAQARRARIEGRAAVIRYQELVRDVVLEVKTVLRDLRTSWQLAAATRAVRLAATENLRALRLEQERRSSLTPEFMRLVFDLQERLARAQLEELQSIANYNRARAAYARAVGTGRTVGATEPAD